MGSTRLSAPTELIGTADAPSEGPELLQLRRAVDSGQWPYAAAETVPIDGVVPKAWLDGVVDGDGGRGEPNGRPPFPGGLR